MTDLKHNSVYVSTYSRVNASPAFDEVYLFQTSAEMSFIPDLMMMLPMFFARNFKLILETMGNFVCSVFWMNKCLNCMMRVFFDMFNVVEGVPR